MAITVRHATAGDEQPLHALATLTFGLACPPEARQTDIDEFIATHLSVERFAGHLADPARILLMALDDGSPLGYSMLVRGPITDPDVAAVVDAATSVELSKFYLLADRHGSGAAHTLMTATLAAAAGTGAASCWLGVNQRNVRAAKFYAKHGFGVVGVKRFLVGEQWHDDHIRELRFR
ncbi:GCN5 family acetyltransferase [Actinoplanes sp. SE50]|uniref:GNAT family N-acetyltransferase n=1 Tax=unclassified Actinoplanes TaxID=2626549 RepID=UPI00023ECFCB|nr:MULTISPECIES: GNAT family N-acetyltransferase [unclassified Actinoplanes]AEV82139.1 GCN5-related N-acetyltransferase [Actinoplanes sp. SE50/110]ATO80538.1 GCN5 family acetyltransferase [Actinoplanes sp. SE50]SLL97944.1 GCN5 family acetyltransferase [Actinoplanes sp. SE50/110]